MNQGPNWFLCNQNTDQRFEDLSFDDAVKILNENVNYKIDLDPWLAWNELMTEWLPISKISVLFSTQSHKQEKKKIAPPPIPNLVAKKKITPPSIIAAPIVVPVPVASVILDLPAPAAQAEAQVDTVMASPAQKPKGGYLTRRRFERYSMRLRVVLFCEDKTFRTFTSDLSEGGMLLVNKVPEAFLRSPCEILIGSPDLKENVQFIGNVIGDASNPFRFAFIESGDNSTKRMAQWFALFSSLNQRSA